MTAATASRYTYSLYLGPHSRLSVPFQKLLVRNPQLLLEARSEFPKPGHHRDFLADFLKNNNLVLDTPNAHQRYLAGVLQNAESKHIIYNYDAFFGSRKSALVPEGPYPSLEAKIDPLRRLLGQQSVVVFLCLKPYHKFVDDELADFPEQCQKLVSQFDANGFTWQPFVSRLRAAFPEAILVIIEEEDVAKDWAAIVELITGSPQAAQFDGIDDFPTSAINQAGRRKYLNALRAMKQRTTSEWVHISRNFLAEYNHHVPAITRIFPSYWSEEQSERSQHMFDIDMLRLSEMPNVTLAADLIEEFL